MPMMLLWAAPAVMFSGVGYYWIAVADLLDDAVAFSTPVAPTSRRRPQFTVIQGGKY
ncbi:hypothetical protein [Bradyrhizobium sp. JYMT SZCCT0428]|uniref:hypothetical protein n=1 Tax=Bradyrhizobium sp. JYMT SZCCT0428 TaxID=2807673 RepID=UPI001BA65EFE|nr:hypothetical protein [Bradyrhizobium sp. JYMT SZCCT0428]MBR1157382.1 hypothetical protein [Bradyrhizobium sp. JYMT SZCCT0428]